ncbi:MAG TPA: lipid-binding SYLF domain-containing protein [Blastocatellia bacterium]|nr:lipid-binding SYLF domain-containing protein [Blastocatellia bacterium]
MKNRAFILLAAFLVLLTAGAGPALARADDKGSKGDLKGPAKESDKAAEAFRDIMGTPDKAIPKKVLDSAECVAVFPSTIKGGFIVGAQKGNGVVSCRTANGWSAPVFLDLSGGSVGAQIGGQSTDYVFLIMNRTGVNHLLSNKFSLGGEASVAAGPVGREAGASTDWKLKAEILSYSRSRGLFAGVELKGVVISTDGSDMRAVYGGEGNAKDILLDNRRTAPAEVQAFPKELGRYSTAVGEKGRR